MSFYGQNVFTNSTKLNYNISCHTVPAWSQKNEEYFYKLLLSQFEDHSLVSLRYKGQSK